MDSEEYDHQRALTLERDMSRRIGHLKTELPHVRVAYKDIVALVQSLEKMFVEVRNNCELRIQLAERSSRTRHETLFFLKECSSEIFRIKSEFSLIRLRAKGWVQSLIDLEQTCVDTHGALLELTQSINHNI